MILARLMLSMPVLLSLALVPLSAAAQTSPPPGILTLPRHRASTQPPAAPVTPPRAAPIMPVEQVAPYSSPVPADAPRKPYVPAPGAPARPAEAHTRRHKPTPVVRAPPHVHAQRPAATAAPPRPVVEPAPPAPEQPAETKGTVTGLPLPRWVSLRADEVNLRVGPGMRFPIEWQYHRRDLPVQIIRELEVWRLIRDQDGVKGWVHEATLIGRRSFVVKVAEAAMRRAAVETAAPVAILKQGVIGRIRACAATAAWCQVQVKDYQGWLRRDQMYGIDPSEPVGN